MAEKNRLFNPQEVAHEEVIIGLVQESSPRKTFLMLILIASMIATLGLLNDSPEIVIGAMLVSPLLLPILGVSMGILVRDWRMLKLSLVSILFSIGLAIATAVVITFFYLPLGSSHEILLDTNPAFMIPIALGAGAAAAFALSYKSIKEAVTGVAISVALLPPLVTIGIGLGSSDWRLMQSAVELFLINLFGIVTVGFVVFALLGFAHFKRAVAVEVKREEKILQSE
ncbi:MAG: hypothetical protein COU68_01110 [Candidatus Pacebacteria bacterium CG10_big_fil_rev_8_21_14_0_10_45_6]|nr:MAG: hypothetical protein COU68_01110 [Candidatus Pacebacteria bacterium CG10_big_fil_rev_8_21_14_0_10_45_6]